MLGFPRVDQLLPQQQWTRTSNCVSAPRGLMVLLFNSNRRATSEGIGN